MQDHRRAIANRGDSFRIGNIGANKSRACRHSSRKVDNIRQYDVCVALNEFCGDEAAEITGSPVSTILRVLSKVTA
jgi:hypothetical protein